MRWATMVPHIGFHRRISAIKPNIRQRWTAGRRWQSNPRRARRRLSRLRRRLAQLLVEPQLHLRQRSRSSTKVPGRLARSAELSPLRGSRRSGLSSSTAASHMSQNSAILGPGTAWRHMPKSTRQRDRPVPCLIVPPAAPCYAASSCSPRSAAQFALVSFQFLKPSFHAFQELTAKRRRWNDCRLE